MMEKNLVKNTKKKEYAKQAVHYHGAVAKMKLPCGVKVLKMEDIAMSMDVMLQVAPMGLPMYMTKKVYVQNIIFYANKLFIRKELGKMPSPFLVHIFYKQKKHRQVKFDHSEGKGFNNANIKQIKNGIIQSGIFYRRAVYPVLHIG